MHVHLIIGGYRNETQMAVAASSFASRWTRSRWGYNNVQARLLNTAAAREAWQRYILKDLSSLTMGRFVTNLPFKSS